ncbi:MAG TPA: thiol reductant ABC exporter subunit CydD, partial [Solirubrobacteraceae bacterium]
MRRAVDPRLLDYARATRPFLIALVVAGAVGAVLIIAQAWLLADIIAGAVAGGKGVGALSVPFTVLLAVVVARAILGWRREVMAERASARVKAQLRDALLVHVAAIGPGRAPHRWTAQITVLSTRGIDALDGYFSLYLPQLCLAVIVPVAVLAAIGVQDWISALIIAATLPLIPLFMALVGAATRERMEHQLRSLQQLAGHFLDVVAGLPTLKVFGRAKAQISAVGAVTDQYRVATMATLRVTFMSSLILELVATLSVALVAVEIGLRLMGGHLGLRTALMVLVLAPEAYLPLRQLGANYHASTEGIAAAEQIFDVLEMPLPARGQRRHFPDPAASAIEIEGLCVQYPGRARPALDGVSLTIAPGEVLAITGPSGCGKSTLLGVMLGFVSPHTGSVRVGGVDLGELDGDAW